MTWPRASASFGQPWRRTDCSSVSPGRRMSSAVRMSRSRNTERISASSRSSCAASHGRSDDAALLDRAAVALLELEQHRERGVAAGWRARNRSICSKHVTSRTQRGRVVEVGDVQDLGAGPAPLGVGERAEPEPLAHERLGVQAALRVGEQVELEPAHALAPEWAGIVTWLYSRNSS